MSEIIYKEKYLKYKNKYLALKEEIDQEGAGGIGWGTYFIFLNKENLKVKINVNNIEYTPSILANTTDKSLPQGLTNANGKLVDYSNKTGSFKHYDKLFGIPNYAIQNNKDEIVYSNYINTMINKIRKSLPIKPNGTGVSLNNFNNMMASGLATMHTTLFPTEDKNIAKWTEYFKKKQDEVSIPNKTKIDIKNVTENLNTEFFEKHENSSQFISMINKINKDKICGKDCVDTVLVIYVGTTGNFLYGGYCFSEGKGTDKKWKETIKGLDPLKKGTDELSEFLSKNTQSPEDTKINFAKISQGMNNIAKTEKIKQIGGKYDGGNLCGESFKDAIHYLDPLILIFSGFCYIIKFIRDILNLAFSAVIGILCSLFLSVYCRFVSQDEYNNFCRIDSIDYHQNYVEAIYES
jgi:hypothetical protein